MPIVNHPREGGCSRLYAVAALNALYRTRERKNMMVFAMLRCLFKILLYLLGAVSSSYSPAFIWRVWRVQEVAVKIDHEAIYQDSGFGYYGIFSFILGLLDKRL